MPSERPGLANAATLRCEQRFATRLPSVLEGEAASLSAQLLDLSRGGAQAEAASPPKAGSVVRIRVDRFDLQAEVMWAQRRRFGLRFVHPLRATELLVLLSRGRAAARVRSSAAASPTGP